MITDGKQSIDRGPYEHLDVASEKLKQRGVDIYALGIGKNVKQAELRLMVSNQDNIFIAQNFDLLLAEVSNIKQQICDGK